MFDVLHSSRYPIIAASGNQIDVQAAIDLAEEGNTIIVPAGDYIWVSEIIINKAISIMGTGSGIGGTKLIASGLMPHGYFYITNFASSRLVRISGFYFDMVNWTPGWGIQISNVTIDNLRIDHNIFNQGGVAQIELGGSKGVIDHNYFYNSNIAVSYSAGTRAQADVSWLSLAAGTSDALFIEDNHFIDDANYSGGFTNEKIGTSNGGKLVIRHNDFDGDNLAHSQIFSPIMTHGSAKGGGCSSGYWEQAGGSCRRGQSVVEIYNNTFHGYRIDFPIILRGAANLIHDNSVSGTVFINPRIMFREEEYDIGSNWTPARTAWPAEDQVHNSFVWNNTYRGHDFNDGVYGSIVNYSNCLAYPASCMMGVQQNRDYYLHAPCAAGDITDAYGNICTHGKETFSNLNGFTNGNGASDTYPGDGTAYIAHGTMSFTSEGDNAYYGYIPYTYPHPLVSS